MVGCQIISPQSNIPQPLGRDLVFTAKEIREAFEDLMERTGGSVGIWIVLNAVSDEGFVSQSILASRAHMDGATITYHVDRAEKLGLVTREVDAADRRVKRLRLTPAGRRLHKALWAAAMTFQMQLLEGLSDAEQARLRRALAKMRANLAGLTGAEPARRGGTAAAPRA